MAASDRYAHRRSPCGTYYTEGGARWNVPKCVAPDDRRRINGELARCIARLRLDSAAGRYWPGLTPSICLRARYYAQALIEGTD